MYQEAKEWCKKNGIKYESTGPKGGEYIDPNAHKCDRCEIREYDLQHLSKRYIQQQERIDRLMASLRFYVQAHSEAQIKFMEYVSTGDHQ